MSQESRHIACRTERDALVITILDPELNDYEQVRAMKTEMETAIAALGVLSVVGLAFATATGDLDLPQCSRAEPGTGAGDSRTGGAGEPGGSEVPNTAGLHTDHGEGSA